MVLQHWKSQFLRLLGVGGAFLFVLALPSISRAYFQSEGYKGLVPLHCSCDDVEELLGGACYDGAVFDLPNERVMVRVSDGMPCDEYWPYQVWNVPKGTVVSITVTLRSPESVSRVRADLTGFIRQEVHVSHAQRPATVLQNTGKGIAYFLNSDEQVWLIRYSPSISESKKRCTPVESDSSGTCEPDVVEILNERNMAAALPVLRDLLTTPSVRLPITASDRQIYVVVYNGKVFSKDEHTIRSEQLVSALLGWKIPRERITVYFGGYRENWEIEICTGLKGCSPLVFRHPTVHPKDAKLDPDSVVRGKAQSHSGARSAE